MSVHDAQLAPGKLALKCQLCLHTARKQFCAQHAPRKRLTGVSGLQLQDKSLAEALLLGSGWELRVSLPWGPSVEDALLGPAGPSSGPEEEKPDQQELSSKVMRPFCIQLCSCHRDVALQPINRIYWDLVIALQATDLCHGIIASYGHCDFPKDNSQLDSGLLWHALAKAPAGNAGDARGHAAAGCKAGASTIACAQAGRQCQ